VNAGKLEFQCRGEDCDQKVTCELQQIIGVPMQKRGYHTRGSEGYCEGDEELCSNWHSKGWIRFTPANICSTLVIVEQISPEISSFFLLTSCCPRGRLRRR